MVSPVPPHELPDVLELVRRLKEARTRYNVRVRFKDGREEHGAVTYVERLGRGRIIDVDREFALDFAIGDLVEIEY
jgi:hypothetical protein